jgi:uncharacterized protein (DUF302 family)
LRGWAIVVAGFSPPEDSDMNDASQPLGFEVMMDCTYSQAIDRVTGALKEEGFGVLKQAPPTRTSRSMAWN